ncbi:MAG: hypothetical protein DRQ37_03995 [Gammaproteobacteria bacterium]|nr:MAG: hypothetical protein DRQ37_03995 [Gammaproteobacteria bacterium]
MEHREGRREPLRVAVSLYVGGHDLGTFQTRNVSHHGVFVETGDTRGRKNAVVLLAFGRDHDLRIKGAVIHQTKEGIGVMAFNTDDDLRHLLRNRFGMQGTSGKPEPMTQTIPGRASAA